MKGVTHHLLSLMLAMSVTTSVIAQEYQFKFNHQDRSQDLPEYKPNVSKGGMVKINGVQMMGFNTTFKDPRNIGALTYQTRSIKAKLKVEHLRQLDLYAMPNGIVFVPKNWVLVAGGIGQNGSLSYTFVPPAEGNGYLTFYHNGGCVSCAMENASLFFTEAAKDAKEHDFNTYTSSNFPLKIVKIKPNLVSFYAESNNNRLDGIAHYDPHSQVPFWKAEASLPIAQQHLTNPLLNQFITKYN